MTWGTHNSANAAKARVAGLVVIGALLAAACTTSDLDPNADVRLTGRVLTPQGQPAADASVVLSREPSPGDAFGGLGIGLATLGLACAADPAPRICTDDTIRRAETGSDGTFQFEMKGRDTQDTLGFANDFELAAVRPPNDEQLEGAATTVRFLIQRESLELGQLPTWGARVQLAGLDDGRLRAQWPSPPALLGRGVIRLRFDDGEGTVWEHHTASTTADLDGRLLEDASGGASVATAASREGPGSTFDFTYRSPRYPYASAAGAPPSRGASCRVPAATGPPATKAPPAPGQPRRPASAGTEVLSPCPLTDGAFTATPVDQATIDLGRPLRLSLLAVRGCTSRCPVEISRDRRRWTTVATATQPFTPIALPDRPRARYVRVADDGPGGGLTEVSAWSDEPRPARPLLPEPDVAALRPGAGRNGDDSLPVLPIVLATLAVAGVAGTLLGFRAGRRRAAPPPPPTP